MPTRTAGVAERLMKATSNLPFTVTPNDITIVNATGAATLVGSLVTLDFAATGFATSGANAYDYNRCIAVATAHLTPSGGFVFAVAQTAAANGLPVRVRLEGDTLLLVGTGNAAVNTLLMGVNASNSCATATTGLLVIARSKESGAGATPIRAYFKGTGICTSA